MVRDETERRIMSISSKPTRSSRPVGLDARDAAPWNYDSVADQDRRDDEAAMTSTGYVCERQLAISYYSPSMRWLIHHMRRGVKRRRYQPMRDCQLANTQKRPRSRQRSMSSSTCSGRMRLAI